MSNDLSKQMLQLIEEYEEIPRDVLAYNTRKILNLQGMTQHEQDLWLAQLCGTTRNTTYSWFAPHRDAKVPLKVIVMIAADRSIPLQSFFEEVSERSEVVLRKKSPRPSYEIQITEYVKEHPGQSIHQVAEGLGIATQTVRRHLNHYQKNIHER